MMKSKHWDWIILVGVLCFLGGTIGLVFGLIEKNMQLWLPVLGMILIGAGTSGKRRIADR